MIPLLLTLLACTPEPPVYPEPELVTYPRIIAGTEDKAAILARLDDEPAATLLADLRAVAERPYREPRDPDVWDEQANQANGATAQDAAFLAWLLDDEAMAAHAIDLLDRFPTDFETNDNWDVNIRMPGTLFGYGNAIDLLRGTDFYSDAQATEHIEKLVTVTDKFWLEYVHDPIRRQALLGPTQNNHPIRTAAAIASVALFYPESRYAEEQADWAISELDYLWGPDGRYVQPDGGVSEGPFYYGFGLAPSIALFAGMHRAIDPTRTYHRDCRNRQDVDPWAPNDCVEGEPFTFDNPLHREDFARTVDWWVGLRLPSGHCPPLADSYFNPLNGAAIVGAFSGEPHFRWSWEHNVDRPWASTHGLDLLPYHLAWVDADVPSSAPEASTRFFPDAGNAVLRSGWDEAARWLMLVAEQGPARKTVHDHVDGLSFSLAAYGEYLLVDPGYYKVNELTLPETAQAQAHNGLLIDGQGPPAKGLLTDWGDADAFPGATHDGDRIDYAEATQRYRDAEVRRAALMLRDRYFVIADHVDSDLAEPRSFTWRVGGNAGRDAGGTFTLEAHHARWERTVAGVDVHLTSTAPGLSLVEPTFREHRAPHVHRFALDRSLGHHAVVDGVIDAVAPGFVAVLAPYAVGADDDRVPLEVERLDLDEGAAGLLVHTAEATDLVLLRQPGAPTTFQIDAHAISTDAALAVVALDGPSLSLLVRGTMLQVDGVDVHASSPDGIDVVEN